MKPIIVWCLGGLGNQMFQYAFYRNLELEGKKVVLDISGFNNYSLHNGFELTNVFSDLKINFLSPGIIKTSLGQKILRRFKLGNYPLIPQKDFAFTPKYTKYKGNKYLQGYWQSEKYFIKHQDVIRHDFNFPQLDSLNQEYATQILNNDSVSLHVRRGDYVKHPLHGGICTLDYYLKAIKLINTQIKNPFFFVFSDDYYWCRDNLKLPNAIYVEGNTGDNSFRDMALMSLCQHNIIANSSFSWWGAWLNNNPNKIVIAPNRWFNDPKINTRDVIPDTWIKI